MKLNPITIENGHLPLILLWIEILNWITVAVVYTLICPFICVLLHVIHIAAITCLYHASVSGCKVVWVELNVWIIHIYTIKRSFLTFISILICFLARLSIEIFRIDVLHILTFGLSVDVRLALKTIRIALSRALFSFRFFRRWMVFLHGTLT